MRVAGHNVLKESFNIPSWSKPIASNFGDVSETTGTLFCDRIVNSIGILLVYLVVRTVIYLWEVVTVQCPFIGCCSVEVLAPSDKAVATRAAHMSTHRDDNCTNDKSITLLPCVGRFVARVTSLFIARRVIHSAATCRMHTNVRCSIWVHSPTRSVAPAPRRWVCSCSLSHHIHPHCVCCRIE